MADKIILPSQLEEKTLLIVQRVESRLEFISVQLQSLSNIISRLDNEIQALKKRGN